MFYLVDWNTGFIGGFTHDFEQQFNTPKQDVFDDLKLYGITELKIITPQELDELRGFHKLSFQEYCSSMDNMIYAMKATMEVLGK